MNVRLNVYIETNFVLELALLQEQGSSCKEILRLAEAGEIRLVLPAYCLTESHETLGRRHRNREKMRLDLERELRQLSRTAHLQTRIGEFRQVKDLLIDSSAEEKVRLEGFQARLLEAASLIPLETAVLLAAPAISGNTASLLKTPSSMRPSRRISSSPNPRPVAF